MNVLETINEDVWCASIRFAPNHTGEELAGCSWVGVPFAGGMSELAEITARVVMVNDLHRHVINLARVVADAALQRNLFHDLRRIPFHDDELARYQTRARYLEATIDPEQPPNYEAALSYFVACWMGRSSKAGSVARIRATYPAAVQAKQPEAAGTAQQPAAAPTFPNSKRPAPRPFVVAVFEPAGFRGPDDPGGWFFDDSLSQAERRECIAETENFERADARMKREAEKNSAVGVPS